MDKTIIKAKKVECIIGLFFLLPPVLGVFVFILQLFERATNFFWMLSSRGGGIYLGLMAIAGVYLIKVSFYIFFVKDE